MSTASKSSSATVGDGRSGFWTGSKGRDTPLDIYEPLGPAAEITEDRRSEADLFTRGVELYRGRRWPEAEQAFRSLIDGYGDRNLYRLYIDRIRHFIAEPPPEAWDGVFDFQTK